MKKSILITGGTGFIGKNLKEKLERDGFLVTTLSRSQQDKENHIQLDLSDSEAVLKKLAPIIKDFNFVIHCAANPNPKPDNEKPNQIIRDNIESTHNIARLLDKEQKLIFMSSILVYDKNKNINPQNIYGITKFTCEQLIDFYSKTNGFTFTSLRISACVGHEYLTHGMLFDLLNKIKNNSETFDLLGCYPGSVKPYVHIDDLYRFVRSAFKLNLQVADVFPEDYLSVNDVASILIKEFKSNKTINFLGAKTEWVGDQKELSLKPDNMLNKCLYSSTSAITEIARIHAFESKKNEKIE